MIALAAASVFAERHHTESPLSVSSQLIIVTTPDWNAVNGQLQMYQRSSPKQPWKPVGTPVAIVVGKGGMGWGIGTQSLDAVRHAGDPVKREGDHKSPAGIFSLGTAFGYAPQPPAEWRVRYLPITPSTDCVDDPDSSHYNQIVDSSTVTSDWKSAEHMRDAGEAYRWGLVVEHNAAPPQPHGGSCVFVHIWDGPGHGTEGCTAMPEAQVTAMLAWLDPAAHPLLVQMPVRQYLELRRSLHLPAAIQIAPRNGPPTLRPRPPAASHLR